MIIKDGEFADIPTRTGSMRTYIFRPAAPGKYPGVLLYSEIFQITGPIRRTAAMLAGHGYVVAAPEIYHELEPAGTVLPYDQAGADRGNAHKTAKFSYCVPRILPSEFMSSFSQRARDLMQAKNTYIAVSLLLTCCLALSLASCQSFSWHLAASKKGDSVELCLSNGDECPQPGGVSPSSISVYRWDNTHDNELVWDAEPENSENPITAGNISGIVTYGVPPKNWINKLAPPALVCGKAYLVNPGAHYFALKCDGTIVVFDDPHLEEFFSGKMHPQNRTK